MIMLTAAGSNAHVFLAEFGVTVGKQASKKAIAGHTDSGYTEDQSEGQLLSGRRVRHERAAVRLGKLVPRVGGLVGGRVDAAVTRGIGQVAKNIFSK
jgi:hypothetical protein